MRLLNYRILLRKEPEGGYSVIVPSLPGCITFGESIDKAIKMAKEAIELYIESLKKHGEKIPTEERVETPITIESLLKKDWFEPEPDENAGTCESDIVAVPFPISDLIQDGFCLY